jgi:hypothetical protein
LVFVRVQPIVMTPNHVRRALNDQLGSLARGLTNLLVLAW